MDKEINCLLCQSSKLEITELLQTDDIIKLWEKQHNNVRQLFNGVYSLEKYLCNNCNLEFFYPFVPGDDKFYSDLGQEEWYYLHEDKTEFSYSNKYIQDGDSVLDIGSGRGAFTKYIDKNITYTGLDLSSKAVEYAKEENINVLEQTIENYADSNKETHNVVVAFQVLEHIINIDSFITSSLQVLKPNGLLILAVPNNFNFIKDAQNHLLNLPPHHTLHWNSNSLRYIAKKFNLEIVDIYQEELTNIHKNWYYTIKLSKIIHNFLGMQIKSINMSFLTKLINITSILFIRIFKFSFSNEKKDGMTIAITLKKRTI